MNTKFLSIPFLALLAIVLYSSAQSSQTKIDESKQKRMEEILKNLPDSVFVNVKTEDLLNDEVYMKLAHDGWTPREIMTIMETAVKDKKKAKEKFGYGYYAKQWRPTYGRSLGDDPLYQFVDTTLSAKAIESIIEAVGENNYNATWEVEPYDASARKKPGYQRRPGYFRQVRFNPSSGRTHWIVANQNDDEGNELYVVTDNAGIFSTKDGGTTWECITDNIPDRANRSQSTGYSLPVDPDNWDHLFAFMANSTVFETTDGGETWRRIEGATHKSFKRGYCFRDKQGTLRFIGAQPNGNSGKLWISQDTCKTWTEIKLPADLLEPSNNFWFQQVVFPADNRDLLYFPGSRSILYMDDGGRGEMVNGVRTYTLKRMKLNITGTDKDGNVRDIKDANFFPMECDSPGFLEINPLNSKMMWFAAGRRTDNKTALYFTDNGGQSWETFHEPVNGFGSGSLFGNETAGPWLGGFGVEFIPDEPDQRPTKIFGCSMSSAYSLDGGRNFTEYAWGTRQHSYITEGAPTPGYYYVSASRHNADNHCIFSHKSGKVFRGGDGGFFVHDPKISGVDPSIRAIDWVNISSNMGQMLFYNVRANEFGDQAIIGNTQDIDIQTYRYGRWGHWRGYEGCEASFNPYTSTGYMSGGGGGYAPEGMDPDSWNTARNYADVVTGTWFMLRTWSGNNTRGTLFRIDDIGRSLTDLYSAIGARVTDLALARDKGRLTVFIKTADNVIRMSTDSCKTFVPLTAYNGKPAAFSGSHIVCDPDNSNILYLGQNNGKVWKYTVDDGKWVACGSGLPTNINCSRIFFHEGSGDLYYCDTNSGIYILKNGEEQWRFWTRGYNNSKFNDVDINYTTQEMVISDYGRGVWVADLETPADRYFKDGFKLKEISHRDGIRVIGIDTEWTIPMYYNYKWKVGSNYVDNPYQYLFLNDTVPATDIQLTLTLREAPDVSTTSEVFSLPATSESTPIARHQGNYLYSTGQGRVDIGYMDWFYNDFSVDLWINAASDGVILSNSQLTVEKGAKGWVLYIDNGMLKFKYYPSNYLQQPTYEDAINQNPVITGGAIAKNKWTHVAVTQERHGDIKLYINGELSVAAKRVRDDEPHTLNNSVIMSLFGDSFEHNPLEGAVDELKVWKKALTINEVRREMFSTNLEGNTELVAHYDFNGDNLEDNRETFTQYRPVSRTRAVTKSQRMTVPLSADYVGSGVIAEGKNTLVAANGSMPVVDIVAPAELSGVEAVVYAYDGNRWENPDDNLSELYYTPTGYGYMIRTFGDVSSEATADVIFHNGKGSFERGTNYRMYMADNADDRMYWKQYQGRIEYDNGNLKLPDARLADITDRKLLLVTMKPAIELTIDGLSSDGRIIMYDDAHEAPAFNFTARLLEDKKVKNNSYEIMSDSSVVIVPEKPLSFDNNGVATGVIRIDPDKIGDFNTTISTFIRGKNDDDMIPIPVDILNRITPKNLGHPVEIAKGCLRFGSAADFAVLKGSNHATMMGWVRVDDFESLKRGRNGDGVAPLIFFRSNSGNNTAAGIHMREGRLGYHWTDRAWDYNATTPFAITKDDEGKWFHVALVIKPNGAWVYFNGMEYKMTGTPETMPVFTADSPLLLGTNTQGNYTYFSGAFDHVVLWNRSLSREEIRKYMHNRVLLNDPELIAYITMDEFDSNGKLKETLVGMPSSSYGAITIGNPTPVPFAPFRQNVSLESADCPISLSGGVGGYVDSFEGTPYNYVAAPTDEQQYLPINHEYYTVIFNGKPTWTDNIAMTYNFSGLVDGETIAVGIRDIGSTTPFTDYIVSDNVLDGKATFSIPANRLTESSELMFFSTPNSSHRPTIVRMSFNDEQIEDGGIYLLPDGVHEIDVDVNVVSGNDDVFVTAKEPYVNLSFTDVDMNDANQTLTLSIDKEMLRKVNPFGLSPVTLTLVGTIAEPLTLQVGLMPRVELKLKNGTDEDHFTATKAVSTLDIDVELIEGYLDKDVELTVTPETLNSAFNISNGNLLRNDAVNISGLSHAPSSIGTIDEGWNLISNPFLTDINITKSQNVEFDSDKVTRFVYHTLEGSNNIVAFDMTDYDSEQSIKPFQSFYVQTMSGNSDITITPIAKERSLNKKTFDSYTASEVRLLTLKLLDDSGNEIDRTTIRWDEDAHDYYQLNEDAPKVSGANAELSNSIYSLSEDKLPMSINYIKEEAAKKEIPLELNIVDQQPMNLFVSRMSGFDQVKHSLYFKDGESGDKPQLLAEGMTIPITVGDEGVVGNRFFVVREDEKDISGTAETLDAHEYKIFTGHRTATITGLQGDAVISVYTTSGALILREHSTNPTFTTEIASGVYVVDIHENNKDFSTKIVVR